MISFDRKSNTLISMSSSVVYLLSFFLSFFTWSHLFCFSRLFSESFVLFSWPLSWKNFSLSVLSFSLSLLTPSFATSESLCLRIFFPLLQVIVLDNHHIVSYFQAHGQRSRVQKRLLPPRFCQVLEAVQPSGRFPTLIIAPLPCVLALTV